MDDHESYSVDVNARVAEVIAEFQSIFLPYPRHIEFMARCDYLLRLGQQTRGRPQKGMRGLAPSGSGKTTAAEAFISEMLRRHPDRPLKAIRIPLEKATTTKTLMITLLRRLGDGYASRGTEEALKHRVLVGLRAKEVDLLFIDEVQHLNFRSSTANDVTDALKSLLDSGAVPIVFLGTEDADDMFQRNLQLNSRLISPCDFTPLDPTSKRDRDLLGSYIAELEDALIERKLIGRSNPSLTKHLAAFHAVSKGVIGRVSRLTEIALELSIRLGRSTIEKEHFALAVDRWAIPYDFVQTNPFRES